MGVPQLLQTLEKIKKPETKAFPGGNGNEQVTRPKAVIDGSALAHHVFNRYIKLASKDERISHVLGFEYSGYQKAVISYLKRLEAAFDILGIYVDGHLPCYKTETRISRIQTSVNFLSRLRNLSPSVIDLHKTSNWNPTPPFLIMAFSSAIQSHDKYSSLLHTVAGEADAFCAEAAYSYTPKNVNDKDDIAVIFTSDSDLLVYPARPHTHIALLNDILFENTPEGSKVKVTLWSPTKILQSFPGGEGNMLQLVWCLQNDPMRIASLLSGSKNVLSKVQVGKGLADQYSLPTLPISKAWIPGVILDSRASEIIYRAKPYKDYAVPKTQGSDVAMYLPVLVEDVTKASAWSIGADIRKFAYTLLFEKDTVLAEVHRKAVSVNRSSINLKGEDRSLIERLSDVDNDNFPDIHPLVVFILLEIIEDRIERNSPLSEYDILALLAAVTPAVPGADAPTIHSNHWTWPRNQLLSQLQAGLYSIYLLQTVISLPNTILPEDFEPASQLFRTFPPLLSSFSTARFMHLYSLAPNPSAGKNARNRARRKLKARKGMAQPENMIQNVMQRVFRNEDVDLVTNFLKRCKEREIERETQMDMDTESDVDSGNTYMGMTIE